MSWKSLKSKKGMGDSWVSIGAKWKPWRRGPLSNSNQSMSSLAKVGTAWGELFFQFQSSPCTETENITVVGSASLTFPFGPAFSVNMADVSLGAAQDLGVSKRAAQNYLTPFQSQCSPAWWHMEMSFDFFSEQMLRKSQYCLPDSIKVTNNRFLFFRFLG